jgi:hypothetical protein
MEDLGENGKKNNGGGKATDDIERKQLQNNNE